MSDDATMHESKKRTLKTARCLRVPVLDEDEAIIKSNAKSVGLSTAEYLRRTLPSTLDEQAVSELAKINADQGRLGGLLKLWLTPMTRLSFSRNLLTSGEKSLSPETITNAPTCAFA